MTDKNVDEKNTIKELESKIEGMSKQLEKLEKLQNELFAKDRLIESSRRGSKEMEKRYEAANYVQALLMGLLLGILGNVCVSFFMKVLEPLSLSSLNWLSLFACAFVVTGTIVFWFRRIILKTLNA